MVLSVHLFVYFFVTSTYLAMHSDINRHYSHGKPHSAVWHHNLLLGVNTYLLNHLGDTLANTDLWLNFCQYFRLAWHGKFFLTSGLAPTLGGVCLRWNVACLMAGFEWLSVVFSSVAFCNFCLSITDPIWCSILLEIIATVSGWQLIIDVPYIIYYTVQSCNSYEIWQLLDSFQ